MKYYLNNPHHNDILSHGRRHLASVDISGLPQFLSYDCDYYSKMYTQSLYDLILEHIKSLPRNWIGMKPRSVRLGSYKFSITTYDKQDVIRVKPLKNADMFNTRTFRSDGQFTSWFTQYYDFKGLGLLTQDIYSIMATRYKNIQKYCIEQFHIQCNPNVDRRKFNPEVCCRQITFAYWSAITLGNAVAMKSFETFTWAEYRSNTDCVHEFEAIVNAYNKTNIHHSKLYYNADSTKRDQKFAYEMAKAILRK